MTADPTAAAWHRMSLARRRLVADLYGPLQRWNCDLELPAGPGTVWIGIDGPASQALMYLELRVNDESWFVLGTEMDGRGTPLPAGEMLRAFAHYSGRGRLGFEQRLNAGPSMRAQLTLWLNSHHPAATVRARVERVG